MADKLMRQKLPASNTPSVSNAYLFKLLVSILSGVGNGSVYNCLILSLYSFSSILFPLFFFLFFYRASQFFAWGIPVPAYQFYSSWEANRVYCYCKGINIFSNNNHIRRKYDNFVHNPPGQPLFTVRNDCSNRLRSYYCLWAIGINRNQSESIRINQNRSKSIRINQNRSESIRINRNQSELIGINRNQSELIGFIPINSDKLR